MTRLMDGAHDDIRCFRLEFRSAENAVSESAENERVLSAALRLNTPLKRIEFD